MMSADVQKTRKLDNQLNEPVEAGLAGYCQCLLQHDLQVKGKHLGLALKVPAV